jgi:hypothetical protein
MIPELSKLSSSEKELVFKAPLLVCILIAGADGKIDNKEMSEAITIARDRQWVKPILNNYFVEVSEDFEDKIKMLIQSYPYDLGERNAIISSELAGLSPLWPKLGEEFSISLFESLKFLAQRIASSSGGFWGKISAEEAQLMALPMINSPA